MTRPNKYLAIAAMMGCAAYGNAGTATISPALAACSKALVESLTKADPLPTYSIKAPSSPVSSLVDPYSFTVLAHSKKTNELLAKASCKATPEGEIVTFKSIPLKS
jgi:hypothetical protein